MHVFFLFTGSGPLVILSSYASVEDPSLLRKLSSKGIEKFLAYEIPLALAKQRYAKHFDGFDQRPLGVRHVARVAQPLPVVMLAIIFGPHNRSLPSRTARES
jgi:hypothetical protein